MLRLHQHCISLLDIFILQNVNTHSPVEYSDDLNRVTSHSSRSACKNLQSLEYRTSALNAFLSSNVS